MTICRQPPSPETIKYFTQITKPRLHFGENHVKLECFKDKNIYFGSLTCTSLSTNTEDTMNGTTYINNTFILFFIVTVTLIFLSDLDCTVILINKLMNYKKHALA
jgi:hypothetical protein